MLTRNIFVIVLISLSLILAACSNGGNNTTSEETKENRQVIQHLGTKNIDDSQSNTDNINLKNDICTTYEIHKETYTEEKIKIDYPQIANYYDSNKQKIINNIIKREALKSLEADELDYKLAIFKIDYDIKLMSDNVLSIQYLGYSYYERAPYPYHSFFTTNINMNKGTSIMLSDIVDMNDGFVEKYKAGKLRALKSFQDEELKNLTDNELIKKFRAEDFYLTKDSLGISVGVVHALGDHAEYEIKYQDMADNIKTDNEIWKELLN